MVCLSELSLVDKEMRCLEKFSDLIETKTLLNLFVRLLNFCLSDGNLVLCHVLRALRFSHIGILTYRGKFLL